MHSWINFRWKRIWRKFVSKRILLITISVLSWGNPASRKQHVTPSLCQKKYLLFENYKSLKPSSRPLLCDKTTVRNLLSYTTPFRGCKDAHSLDIIRAISGRRPLDKNFQTLSMEHCDTLKISLRNVLSTTTSWLLTTNYQLLATNYLPTTKYWLRTTGCIFSSFHLDPFCLFIFLSWPCPSSTCFIMFLICPVYSARLCTVNSLFFCSLPARKKLA